VIHKLLRSFGYKVVKTADEVYHTIHDDTFQAIYAACKPYTMTSAERMYGLYKAVQYVAQNNIPGCLVECGAWRGGSAMMMAKTLLHYGISDRKIYLYDTYEGMSEPTENDTDIKGSKASELLKEQNKNIATSVWCYASIEDVEANMARTKYPAENIVYVKGMVENTIPAQSPEGNIAVLRLDTDWYASTLHELQHLYPQLVADGVLVIDDYGHWQGCRKAVDEYFTGKKILFNRVDYTGVVAIKSAN
jgi:O-methyltransferase